MVQKYQCSQCKKYQRSGYVYRSRTIEEEQQVKILNNEGIGISSMSRILLIPKSSIQMLLLRCALKLTDPPYDAIKKDYEIDELYTYIGKKNASCYIIYAIERSTRKIIDFVTGSRTKENIQRLIKRLLELIPRRIYTDKLNVFQSLIPSIIHRTLRYRTNRIERKNLTIRTHLKRLSRKTICYSKSEKMLEASFRLYAFGK